MVFFTTLIGMAQGLLLGLVALDLSRAGGGAGFPRALPVIGTVLVVVIGVVALGCASLHLGRPTRAWRAAAMWRTSWLSREVIVLPAFLGVAAIWGLAHQAGAPTLLPGLAAAALALLLYLCTGMIYAAVKAMSAWAHPVTPLNFGLTGLASGLCLASGLAAVVAPAFSGGLALAALVATVLAAIGRGYAFARALRLAAGPAARDPIGVGAGAALRVVSAGATASTFTLREFHHGQAPARVIAIRWFGALAGFVIPAALLAVGSSGGEAGAWPWLALAIQWPGLLAERWSFFAEARHPSMAYQGRPAGR